MEVLSEDKIYLCSSVGMQFYRCDFAMYVMLIAAWVGMLQLPAEYCLDYPLHSHVGKVVEWSRRTSFTE